MRRVVLLALGVGLMLNNPNLGNPAQMGKGAVPLAVAAGIGPGLRTAEELGAPPVILNPYKMRVFLTNAQTVNTLSNQQVKFDTVTFDTASDGVYGFSTAAWQYKIPLQGYWVVAASVGVVMPAVNNARQSWQSFIVVNGSITENGELGVFIQPAVSSSFTANAMVADTLFLKRGDLVQIWVGVILGQATSTLDVTSPVTYWSMHLIST